MSKWSQQYDVKLQEQKEKPRRPLPRNNTQATAEASISLSSGRVLLPRFRKWPDVARVELLGAVAQEEAWKAGRHSDTAQLPRSSLFLPVMLVLLSVGMYLPGILS